MLILCESTHNYFEGILEICNSSFTDSSGDDCEKYKNGNYCSTNGDYGSGWQKSWGTFEKYAKNGQTAIVCPQCGCINGNYFY